MLLECAVFTSGYLLGRTHCARWFLKVSFIHANMVNLKSYHSKAKWHVVMHFPFLHLTLQVCFGALFWATILLCHLHLPFIYMLNVFSFCCSFLLLFSIFFFFFFLWCSLPCHVWIRLITANCLSIHTGLNVWWHIVRTTVSVRQQTKWDKR